MASRVAEAIEEIAALYRSIRHNPSFTREGEHHIVSNVVGRFRPTPHRGNILVQKSTELHQTPLIEEPKADLGDLADPL